MRFLVDPIPATFHLPRFAKCTIYDIRYTIYILRAVNGICTYMLVVSPIEGARLQSSQCEAADKASERTWDTVSCSMEKIRLYLMHDMTAKHQWGTGHE
jgi:hypothetical protein